MKYHLTELSCVCSCGSGCINGWTSLSDQSIKSFWEFNGYNYLFHLNDLSFTCIGWVICMMFQRGLYLQCSYLLYQYDSTYFEYLNWENLILLDCSVTCAAIMLSLVESWRLRALGFSWMLMNDLCDTFQSLQFLLKIQWTINMGKIK